MKVNQFIVGAVLGISSNFFAVQVLLSQFWPGSLGDRL